MRIQKQTALQQAPGKQHDIQGKLGKNPTSPTETTHVAVVFNFCSHLVCVELVWVPDVEVTVCDTEVVELSVLELLVTVSVVLLVTVTLVELVLDTVEDVTVKTAGQGGLRKIGPQTGGTWLNTKSDVQYFWNPVLPCGTVEKSVAAQTSEWIQMALKDAEDPLRTFKQT